MLIFLGIGAQKSGTTWLFKMLSKHPEISFPVGKEAHYWNTKYPATSPDHYFNKFTGPSLAEGEITPAYAILPVNIIRDIYQYCPDLKLIFIIRNPIDRAWSSAKMALGRAEMELNEASDQWFIDHFNSKNSLLRGDYETCIRNWLNVYPIESLLIIPFENIRNNPELVLNNCCSHIGINLFSETNLEKMHIKKPIFQTTNAPLRKTLYPILEELYKYKINSLSAYLNIDLRNWKTNNTFNS